ncbi:MAG: J domain-containing protein, partial [Deltaproteobacteria bacterium]|nr:J domain-containing protein [Deltaproteobacteria bacterium]
MRHNRWKDIDQARKFLKLPEQVTRIEILEAYRHRCRDLHPDRNSGIDTSEEMAKLNAAYKILMKYVDRYEIKLNPNQDGMTEGEWWMHHFG